MNDKITELTYETLPKMNKTTFARLFKKPMPWQKAKAVLLFAKYKFTNGKLALAAVPFKKLTEAKTCYKDQVKKATDFKPKLVLFAQLDWQPALDGNLQITLTPLQGKMDLEYAQTYARELFAKLKIGVDVVGAEGEMTAEDLKEVLEESGEELSNKKIEKEVKKRVDRSARLVKVADKLGKFERNVGKLPLETAQQNLATFQTFLEELKTEAASDGHTDEEEQAEIHRLEWRLEQLAAQIQQIAEQGAVALTEKQRKTMFKGLDKMEKVLDKIIRKQQLRP